MVTTKIYLRKHKPDADSGFIWIQFYINRQKINFTTGVKCDAKHWNIKKNCIGSGDKSSEDKNRIIENIASRITVPPKKPKR